MNAITGAVSTEPDSGYARLEQQIAWYDAKSGAAQRWFKRMKIAEVICAAAIPLFVPLYPILSGVLGVVVVIAETLQHLYQWQNNWVTYRATCEALRHEKYTYLGRTGPYDVADDVLAKKLLVERVEGLISTEHSKWIASQESAAKQLAVASQAKSEMPA